MSRRGRVSNARAPVAATIAWIRSPIVGWVASAPSAAPSIIIASCSGERPTMALLPSIFRKAETSADGFCVSLTACASAMNSRADEISRREA